MPVHPLWRPFERVSPEEVARAAVARPSRPTEARPTEARPIEVVAPDPAWPSQYQRIADLVRSALGGRVLSLQHVGSTAVPGLHAKPVIDVDLTVTDSADEGSYVPDLEAAGFALTIREPDWEQHRCLVLGAPRCNLHVFSPGAIEPQRHLAFRDWLTTHADDRDSYAALKRRLDEQSYASVMEYNNDKAELIYEIYERIFAADPNARATSE